MLNLCDIPDDILSCQNLSCEEHNSFIDTLHEHIVSSLINTTKKLFPFHSLTQIPVELIQGERFCEIFPMGSV